MMVDDMNSISDGDKDCSIKVVVSYNQYSLRFRTF